MRRCVGFSRIWIVALMMLAVVSCNGDDDDDNNDDAVDDDTDDDDDDNDDNDDNDDTTDDDDDTALTGVEVFQDGDDVVIRNEFVSVRYHLTPGRYTVSDAAKLAVIENAEAAVWSNVLVPRDRWQAGELDLVNWTSADVDNALGTGKSISVTRADADSPRITQTFTLLEGESAVLFDVTVSASLSAGDMKVGAIYPIYANAPEGALHFGNRSDIRVLMDGTVNYLEFIAPIAPGTAPALSDWNILIYNQALGTSLAAGALSFDSAQPIFYYGPGPADGAHSFHADCEYDPAKALNAGESMAAETVMLDFGQPTPYDAMEKYADRVKTWLGIETWLERHPEIGVPVGWNSWSGSGSSGGYGTGINEQIIVDNMDFADRELRRWGMNYFQIDDGWEVEVGDWIVDETKFPNHDDQNGVEWLLDRAKQMGFQTGLWISAFNAANEAQIVQDHPEYWADPFLDFIFDWGERYLDLTKPAAQEHLRDVVQMVVDWGVQWIKLDFAYFSPITTNWYDPNHTRGEFYRTGCQILRDTLGPDGFFLNVAIVGWNIGLVDSVRLTLDTMPAWEGENPSDPISNQGLKPMYRDSARKYYLNNRVFINHPDLIFFRAHHDTSIPPLTLNESQTFATSVALQGGLVKIGDRIVDLQPDWVDSLRKIIPVHQGFSRPLDLFAREYAEVWSVPIDDFDEPYTSIGLLNWGANRDLTQTPYADIADEEREISADLEDAGLDPKASYHAFEFWTQEYLGEVSGTLALDVPARTPRVVALRPTLDRPQFLGTNRHVLGGAVVVHSLAWNAAENTLTGTMEGSVGTAFAPFEHRLTFHIPDGFTLADADVDAPAGFAIEGKTTTVDEDVATLRFTVVDQGDDLAQWHPEISWTLTFSAD